MTDERKTAQEVVEALANLMELPNLINLDFNFHTDASGVPIVKYTAEMAIIPQEEE